MIIKKPVVFIITQLELGGAQKVCLSLYHSLKDERDTYLIVGKGGTLDATVAGDSRVIFIPELEREVGGRKIFRELRALWSLIKTLRSLRTQHPEIVVHTHSTKAGLLGRWAAFFARIKTRIHTVHGFALHPHLSRLAWWAIWACEQLTVPITTTFICVSNADIHDGSGFFWGFARKAQLIRAAVDNKQFVPAEENSSLPTPPLFIIGTIACFKPQKNLLDLLDAFAEVVIHAPHARLEIIGDGIERDLLEQKILDSGLIDQVTLLGWRYDVPTIMKRWQCFALSSLWEGLPCALVEARLMKLPVVAYATGGIPEVIIEGKNGYLIPQKNWHLLANRLIALATNTALYTKMAEYPDNLTSFYHTRMWDAHRTLYDSTLY
jgi:glycosyltransferase involved in cell wall biosynthesis